MRKIILLIIFMICISAKIVNAIDHFVWSYGINKYTYYKIDGTKVVETDPNKIFNFIYPKVKLAVSGTISGIEGIPFETVGVPCLSYASSGIVNSNTTIGGPWSDYCATNAPESYFLYDSISGGRLYKSYYGTFSYPLYIHDITNADLRNNFTDYLQTVTDQQPAGCGLYMDDTLGFLADYAYAKFVSEQVVVNATDDPLVLQIQSSQRLSPMADMTCKVLDPANGNAETPVYYAPWNRKDISIVYLDNAFPFYVGKTVTLKYYARLGNSESYKISHSDLTPINNADYKNGMTSFLQQLKGKVGNNQLVIYNGCGDSYNADFLQYADGCHSENTFNTSDKIYWKPRLDEEIKIANLNKKFLSFNFPDVTSDADIIKKMFFNYASFLLGAGNGSMFSFTTAATRGREFIWFDVYDYDVGVSTSVYTKAIDANTAQPFDANTYVFQRSFTNGFVLVNLEETSQQAALPTGTYYYFDPNTNWVLKGVSSSIIIPQKAGILLFKKAPTTTSVLPTTTTTSVRPTTTTSVLPTTTTTSVKPATTTTVPPNTTTTVSAQCTTDTDCDDNLFCNGAERCDNGVCIQGSNPCQSGQVCSESRDQCKNVRTKPGKSFPETISRPVSTEVKSKLLIVKTAEDNYFDRADSSVVFANSGDNPVGLKLNANRKAFKLKTLFGSLIFLPIQVHKQATVGQWEVLINTEVSGNEPTEETVIANFEIK
jgi:hypothetical protein